MRPIRAVAILCVQVLFSASLLAQTSSNACSAAAANTYPVNGTCIPITFDKPNTYTATYNPGGCGASNRTDAWGSFVATSTVTMVRYTPTTNNANAILHVLASCTGPVLACADNVGNNGAEQVMVNTVPGTRYFVRVQRYNSNTAMNGTLCVVGYGCTYRLTLYDSYGDGWGDLFGNASVTVTHNGSNLGAWSLNNGSTGYLDIPVNNGDVLTFTYATGGSLYYVENSFEVTGNGLCEFMTGRPPMVGQPYTVTVDCQRTAGPNPHQDCAGGTTVCTNQTVVGNSFDIGCVMDLTASNAGCLLAGERQGSWYYFSPTTGGTLGFSLVPNGNIDYDFALWGPFDAAQCPNVPPVRCSYANGLNTNPKYRTGMGNGATDTSEDQYGNGWVAPLNVLAGKVYVLYIDNYSATGQDFTLTWDLGNGASLNCTTLPVELLSLDARPRGTAVDVTWATATEHDAAYFEVQRSADGASFQPIGQIAAAGNSHQRVEYLFTDKEPLNGANYYRLNQVDIDGNSELSYSVVAFMGGAVWDKPVLFPNPARDQLQVLFTSPGDGAGRIEVQDALGRLVARQGQGMMRGQMKSELPTGQLANGWYSLRVVFPDGSGTKSVAFLKE